MKRILVLCAVLAFTLVVPAQAQRVPVVSTSDYYAGPKVLVLHALNNSGKDITGYTIIIRHKNADGTLEENGRSETTSDMLSVLIISQMALDLTTPAGRLMPLTTTNLFQQRLSLSGNEPVIELNTVSASGVFFANRSTFD